MVGGTAFFIALAAFFFFVYGRKKLRHEIRVGAALQARPVERSSTT
jgi:hypothetical protein